VLSRALTPPLNREPRASEGPAPRWGSTPPRKCATARHLEAGQPALTCALIDDVPPNDAALADATRNGSAGARVCSSNGGWGEVARTTWSEIDVPAALWMRFGRPA